PQPNPRTHMGEWGDYLTVRPAFPDRKMFAATGYTMNGGPNASNRSVLPRFVVFGRASSAGPGMGAVAAIAPATAIPAPPMAARPLPPTPPEDGEPFTDVDALDVVSADVAAKIKAAAAFVPGVDVARLSAPTVAAQPLRDTPRT